MDILSDVLRNVRLSGALLFFAEYHAPWCIMCPPSQAIAPMLVPGARQLVIFHIIIHGRCFLGRPDAEPVELAAGDAVRLAQGDTHQRAERAGPGPNTGG